MMMILRVDDPSDPRIAAYRDIRERDLVGRRGRFIAEGKVVLSALLSSRRFAAESALVLESRLAGIRDVLVGAPAAMPVYVVSAEVMDRIAGFNVHRGILACGTRPAEESGEALLAELPARALVLALVGISNHDNMGAIFRNAAAFAVGAVLMDATCCDPLYRKSLRVSAGAVLKVPFARLGNWQGMAEMLERLGFGLLALSPRGTHTIGELPRPGRVALFLGTEGEGLPEKLLGRLPSVRIPMADGFDSLNVATAAAIALHRLWR